MQRETNKQTNKQANKTKTKIVVIFYSCTAKTACSPPLFLKTHLVFIKPSAMGYAWSNFEKKYNRLLAVYVYFSTLLLNFLLSLFETALPSVALIKRTRGK